VSQSFALVPVRWKRCCQFSTARVYNESTKGD
jgi:hypothetical protein